MTDLNPKYITFDCYGTLTRFRMGELAQKFWGDKISPDRMPALVADFSAYRFDEVLGAWKPYRDVLHNATRRTAEKWGLTYREEDGETVYQAVPTWGPHDDVPAGLSRLASKYKLVILSNASNEHIQRNVDKLGAPFHAVFTAEQAQSYKPRFQGFEYMLKQLGCGPDDLLHVSASLRYDLISCWGLGIKNKVYVNRGYEPSTPYYGYHEVSDIGGLATLLGV